MIQKEAHLKNKAGQCCLDILVSNLRNTLVNSKIVKKTFQIIYSEETNEMTVNTESLSNLISANVNLSRIKHRIKSAHIRQLFDKFGETPFINSKLNTKYVFDSVPQRRLVQEKTMNSLDDNLQVEILKLDIFETKQKNDVFRRRIMVLLEKNFNSLK